MVGRQYGAPCHGHSGPVAVPGSGATSALRRQESSLFSNYLPLIIKRRNSQTSVRARALAAEVHWAAQYDSWQGPAGARPTQGPG
eukprot:611306-Hanusia_phi.AAC.2